MAKSSGSGGRGEYSDVIGRIGGDVRSIRYSEKYTDGIPGSKNQFQISRGGQGKEDKYFLTVSNTQLRYTTMARLDSSGNIDWVENWTRNPADDLARVRGILGRMR